MWVAGSLRHTTAMDGGSADIASLHGCNLLGNAGAIAEEQISVRPSLNIFAPPSLALCDIPHIPVHKKSNDNRCFILHNIGSVLNR